MKFYIGTKPTAFAVCVAARWLSTRTYRNAVPNADAKCWPALSTAIIVAITRNEGKEILLVQGKNFKRDYLGLVAGYVETGEDLETCVRREVMEETGLRIRNLRYFAYTTLAIPQCADDGIHR